MNHATMTASAAHHEDVDIFGFWIYILSDCILFAAIFASFAVLHTNVYDGPALKALVNIPDIFAETMLLLTSSLSCGLSMLALYRDNIKPVLAWLGITFLLGMSFVGLEVTEFVHLCQEGFTWQRSAAGSVFFTLVGTHGLHVVIGLLWMLVLMVQFSFFKMTPMLRKRFTYFSLFWAFLDIVWIFVFTVVYLMGAI